MAERIEALWKRLGDMYGAKALESKFGLTPPDTWRIAIDRLKDFELERGMRRLVYGGRPHIPTLPEFLRMCREVGGDHDGDAKPVPPERQLARQPMARWETDANLHLLGYVTRRAAVRRYYVEAAEFEELVRAKGYWAQDMREHEAAGAVPTDGGKAMWDEYMANAEAAIAQLRKVVA